MKNTIITLLALTAAAGSSALAQLQCQVGILTPETLAGNNPATGAPWQVGDQYRFVFHTSATTTAESTDIATYNAWVQGLADASTVYPIGAGDGVTWKVIGSTNDIDARDNTSTNPEEDGTGHAIFLLDGSTVVANDYADLWDGEIQHIINLTEKGEEWAYWPFTGTHLDGTKAPGHANSFAALGGGAQIHQGFAGNTTQWAWRMWTGDPPSTQLPMYALSDPLTIVGDSSFRLTITPAAPAGYDLAWESQSGMRYNLRSSEELGNPVSTWTLVEGGIVATPDTNRYTVNPSEPGLFFAVEEFPAPPVTAFAESFDGVTAPDLPDGWTTGAKTPPDTATTVWELGSPSVVGPAAASSAPNCVGTNLGADYGLNTDIWLRTPPIDLTAASAGTLALRQFRSIENVPGIDLDFGSIRILAADDLAELAVLEAAVEGADTEWVDYSKALPAEAFAEAIVVEFRFQSDDIDTLAGWYIDDVVVTVPGS